ncbi:hypothetical protein CCHR01_08663 [Colletotrichum chrysophilum]|uniref:Uncharacterized protein n=1 Tax=Colletotrichum chrysophilum TaxID=1836956 RepID=A0AAD9AJU1_9PEZI|nr:hypothetical protein CCHR01_08663 [Colletotrichum chrysophilum]
MFQSLFLALAVLAVVPIATAAPTVDISKTNALLTSPSSTPSQDLLSFESWIDGISTNPNGTHLSSDEAIAAAIRTPMSRGKGIEQPDLQRKNSPTMNVFRRSLLKVRKVVKSIKPGEKGLKTDEASTVGIGLEGVQCNTYPRQLSVVSNVVFCIEHLARIGNKPCYTQQVTSYCQSGPDFILGWRKVDELSINAPSCAGVARSAGRIMDFCTFNGKVMGQTTAFDDPAVGVMIRAFPEGKLPDNITAE